ncbi:SprB repeat-containing protein, partial [Terrimonas alba]|uniref:SprB repeat-containing protein n=1 Tax=Terrimonas alba TaxID=3349636 RepID=UPI0035F466D3
MSRDVCFPNQFPYPGPWVKTLAGYFKTYIAVLLVFISTKSFAQTFPPLSSCTSKDLELVGASLPAPANDPCQCSGMRTLVLTIANKTGSTRTSFALWGTLVRYNAAGTEISREPIVACAGPIPKNSTTPLVSDKEITISCGESLDIIDLYLAWTSASPGETCSVLKANPSTINPKCGTLPLIHVGIGVDGALVTTNATCSAGGSIKVTPSGGVGPYTVKLDNGTPVNVAAGAFTTFTNVSAGAHSVVITDSRNCSTTKNPSVGSPAAVTANAGGDFEKTCIANTSGQTIGEVSEAGFTYSWTPTAGLSATNVSNPTANPTSTTTYTVTKTNIATGCSDDDAVTVTVNTTAPTADAGDDFTKTCTANASGKQIGEANDAAFT